MKPRIPVSSTRESLKRLKALVEASHLLNSSLNLKKILAVLLDLATKNLDADRGTIYLVDREKNELWSQVVKGDKTLEIRLPLGKGIAGTVGKTGKTIMLKDPYKDERFDKRFDEESGYRTKTMLCTPMKDKAGKIVGVFQILNKRRAFFNKQDERFLAALSIPASLAIENARLHLAEIENQRMEKELEVAAEIQQQLLPKELPKLAGIQLSAISIPSRTVGGDFYDVIKLDEQKVALVIADVSGKGVPAALLVSTLQAALRTYLELGFSPLELVPKLNNLIYNNATAEKFITFALCVYDTRTSTLLYVNAGHNYPLIVQSGGGIFALNISGLCLGVLPDSRYEQAEIRLHPGDILSLYTDGVTEANNKKYELYGEPRLFSMLSNLAQKDVRDIEIGILEDVRVFSDGTPQADDITMVLMKINHGD